MKVAWRKSSWQIRLPEINLSCSERLWQDWRWKFFLASGGGTRGPLSLSALHNGVCSLLSSSGNQ